MNSGCCLAPNSLGNTWSRYMPRNRNMKVWTIVSTKKVIYLKLLILENMRLKENV